MTPEETGALISDMLGKGRSLQVIIARSGWSKFEVIQIAESNGYHFDAEGAPHKDQKTRRGVPASPHEALQRMYDDPVDPFATSTPPVDLEPHDQQDSVTIPTTTGPVTIPIKPAAAGTDLPLNTSLVARGQRSPVKRIKALADKCADLLEQLYTTLDEQDAKDKAAAEKAAAEAAARAEVARLEKQLADARLRLRPATKAKVAATPSTKSPSSLEREQSKAIREWGHANGFEVANVGRLKPELVAAYYGAHPEAATA